MRNWLLRLLGLRTYVQSAISAATRDAYVKGHVEGQHQGQQIGYQIGHAQGELHGRQALTLELQQEFGADNHNVFEGEDALRFGARLKH